MSHISAVFSNHDLSLSIKQTHHHYESYSDKHVTQWNVYEQIDLPTRHLIERTSLVNI